MDELTSLVKSFVLHPSFKTNLQAFKRTAVEDEIKQLDSNNLASLKQIENYAKIVQSHQDKLDKLLNRPSASISTNRCRVVHYRRGSKEN